MNFVDPMEPDKLLGAFRVASGIKDAVVIVHAPVGCHWGVNFIERLSYGKTNSTLSALRERSVIFGGHEHLEKSIRIIFRRKKRKYLIILAASVSSIIGDDIEGITESAISGMSYIILDCGGYMGRMMNGYEECLDKLSVWIEKDNKWNANRFRYLVNIIGLQRDMPMGEANIKEIKRMLKLLGIKVNSIFPPLSIKEIKNAAKADLNIVFYYGRGLAEIMKQRYGIPYIFFDEYPYGLLICEKFLKRVSEYFEINKKKVDKIINREKSKVLDALKPARIYFHTLYNISTLVSGDLAQVKGISHFLSKEIGCRIKLINITSSSPNVQVNIEDLSDISEKLLFQVSMHEFEENIQDIDIIFGSEIERKISKKTNIPIIPFSYPILSKLSLNGIPYMGFKGVLGLFEQIINTIIW